MVVVIAAVLGIAVMFMPGSLIRRKKIALDDRQRFEAHLLAGDLVEIGKYFLMYERVMFTTDPLHLREAGTGGAATRGECLRQVWGQSYGTFRVGEGNMKDACGITGANGSYQGDLALSCGGGVLSPAKKKTFCPGLLRDPNLSGDMFEEMRFQQWKDKGMVTEPQPGVYQLRIEMTNAFKPSKQDDMAVRLYHGQKFLDEMFRSGEGSSPLQAWLIYDFMSGDAFKAAASERYVKVTGKLTFKGARGAGHFVERSETMMIVPTTPRDFALFVPFPDKGTLPATNDPTNKFSQSMILPASVQVHGRVYFNGDVDTDLVDLPEFHEAVALSGNIKDSGGKIPGPSDLALLKQKFRKGFVTNLSAPRFMLDGDCAANGATSSVPIRVSNGTNFQCLKAGGVDPYGIVDYLQPLGGCWSLNLQITSGSRVLARVPPSASVPSTCLAGAAGLSTDYASGGFRDVTAAGTYSSIMSPAKRFTALSNVRVYGTVLGGHVNAASGVRFYSASSLFPGLPGIGTQAALIEANSSAAVSYHGVTVAIPNLPLILVTGEEGK